jgi:hypothetical protein
MQTRKSPECAVTPRQRHSMPRKEGIGSQFGLQVGARQMAMRTRELTEERALKQTTGVASTFSGQKS